MISPSESCLRALDVLGKSKVVTQKPRIQGGCSVVVVTGNFALRAIVAYIILQTAARLVLEMPLNCY